MRGSGASPSPTPATSRRASRSLGVTTVALGSSQSRYARSTASPANAAPVLAPSTGSITRATGPRSRSRSTQRATTATLPALPRRPVLMAAGGMSSASAASCASSKSASTGATRATPTELCAVMAATTGHRCTPKAAAARASADRPAPPPLSLPAMLQTMGARGADMLNQSPTDCPSPAWWPRQSPAAPSPRQDTPRAPPRWPGETRPPCEPGRSTG